MVLLVAAVGAGWFVGRRPQDRQSSAPNAAQDRRPATSARGAPVGALAEVAAARERAIEAFRVSGQLNRALLKQLEETLKARLEAKHAQGKARSNERKELVKTQLELGTVLRLRGRYSEAIEHLLEAERTALEVGLPLVAIDSAIALARSYVGGSQNYSAAAAALGRAQRTERGEPTPARRYEVASYSAELQATRGEFEGALASAIEALNAARQERDRFYARFDLANILKEFARSCDYRVLVDARSAQDDEDDGDLRGGCRRALEQAEHHYAEAQRLAEHRGWKHLADDVKSFRRGLQVRRLRIAAQAEKEQTARAAFMPDLTGGKVQINTEFAAAAAAWSDLPALLELLKWLEVDVERPDVLGAYLLGGKAELSGQAELAQNYYRLAATQLLNERSTLLDARHRGTVVENRSEYLHDLALRLLAGGDDEHAFTVWETLHAHALTKLQEAYQRPGLDAGERKKLAQLLQAQSSESLLLRRITALALADTQAEDTQRLIAALSDTRAKRQAQLSRLGDATLSHVEARPSPPISLAALREAVKQSGIPVLLYGVIPTGVVVWLVAPSTTQVQLLWLPPKKLEEQVERVATSLWLPTQTFARAEAEALYTTLVAPFNVTTRGSRLLIVPQGELAKIPFEVLVNPTSGRFLMQERAIGYAPNATFAAAMLKRDWVAPSTVNALIDQQFEASTQETTTIAALPGVDLQASAAQQLTKTQLLADLSRSSHAHLSLGGRTVRGERELWVQGENGETLIALDTADTAALDLRRMSLCVLSANEDLMLATDATNEVAGFAWAPLAAGAHNLIIKRWSVSPEHHTRFMEQFYLALSAGHLQPAQAAATTMRAIEATSETAHPYYWASPMLIGY